MMEFAPLGFITNRTKSVAWPPNWNPMFAPSGANSAGALPTPGEIFAVATRNRIPAEIASYANREFQDRRNHNDALGLVEEVLRNPVGDVHNFLEHLAARFKSLLLSAFIRCECRTRQEHGDDKNTGFSHDTTPIIYFILTSA
jgi:hypothetical protein